MNVVLDDAEEVHLKKKTRKRLGMIIVLRTPAAIGQRKSSKLLTRLFNRPNFIERRQHYIDYEHWQIIWTSSSLCKILLLIYLQRNFNKYPLYYQKF